MLTSEPKGWAIATRLFLFAAFAASTAFCIYLISAGSLTDRESAMFGILVTVLSVLASWIITDLYATSQYRDAIKEVREEYRANLRTYALKAAEKVNNLSKELGRLSGYLEQELQESDYSNADEELNAKEERIQSAIHIVNTLKSVNDTALSDWQGVIGDEINEQREKAGQREETLMAVVERLAALETAQADEPHAPPEDTMAIRQELQSLRRDIRTLAGELGAPFLGTRRVHMSPRSIVEAPCPQCNNPLIFRQKARQGSYKSISCRKCESNLISEYSEEIGFTLRSRRELAETVPCPSCATEVVVALDEWPSAHTTTSCTSCGANLRVSRASGEIRVAEMQGPKHVVTDEILKAVQQVLPPQPWPKGIHKTVAEELALAPRVVQKAVNQLISNGVFQDQIDGRIVTAEEKTRILDGTNTKL